jgi:iron complex outermembrane recepter protein
LSARFRRKLALPAAARAPSAAGYWPRVVLLMGLGGWSSAALAEDRSKALSLFLIRPQSLQEALISFSEQSGLQFVAIGDLSHAPITTEVRGRLSNEQALARLLARSGFDFSVQRNGVVTVAPATATLPAQPSPAVVALAPTELAGVEVTARRRVERRIDAPLAITALGGTQLDAGGFQNAAQAIDSAPGASTVDVGGGFTQVQIRGVSSSLGGNDNGYYLDEIPFTGVTVPWHPDARAFDLDRIEVLRGPQGTLFGEGSMGGTVRILTNKPELDRFAALAQAGWSTAEGGGTGWNAKAMANLPLLEDQLALRVVATDESLPGWVDDVAAERRDINRHRVTTRRARLRFEPSENWRFDAAHWSYHSAAPGGGYAADDAMEVGSYYARDADWRTSNLVSTYQGGESSVTYTYAVAELEQRQRGDILPGTRYDSDTAIAVRTHELRWSSTTPRRLSWTAGAYRREARRSDVSVIGEVGPSSSRQDNGGGALFGELTLQLPWAGWTANAGLRYFTDHVEGASLGIGAESVLDERFQSWNPRVGIAWQPVPDTTLYVSTAKGFRSGQLQPVTSYVLAQAAGIALPTRIRPDQIVTTELGAKTLMDGGRLLVEAALFHSRWQDVPVRVPVTDVFNGLVNSDGARIRGIEFGLTYQPWDRLALQLESTLIDATYTTDVAGTSIRRGTQVYNTPRTTWGASLEYQYPVAQDLSGVVRAGVRHHSARQVALTQGTPGDAIVSADARITLESAQGWSASVYGENLSNEDGADDARNTRGIATRLRPRTLGVEFAFRYR